MKLTVLGAAGRTGRLIVEQALQRGDEVRVLVRAPQKLGMTHAHREVVQSDATDEAMVLRGVQGCDAVISTLGPTKDRPDVCSTATRHVITAGPPRYVVISGAGIDVPGDKKDLLGKFISFMVSSLTPAIFRDKVREYEQLAKSSLAWTLVRPPRLSHKPGTGSPRMSLQRGPGPMISRADLAAFVLRCLGDDSLIRRAPFVAG